MLHLLNEEDYLKPSVACSQKCNLSPHEYKFSYCEYKEFALHEHISDNCVHHVLILERVNARLYLAKIAFKYVDSKNLLIIRLCVHTTFTPHSLIFWYFMEG